MKKLLLCLILVFLLTGCASSGRVALLPEASPDTSAMALYTYDGEVITREFLFFPHDAVAVFNKAKAQPVQVDVTTLQPPFYGLEIGNTEGYMVHGLWADGIWVMDNGQTYSLDSKYIDSLSELKWESKDEFETLSIFPCASLVAKSENGWNKNFLTPAHETAPPNGITMTLDERTDTHITLSLTNEGTEEWEYGHGFSIEVELDGQWYQIPPEEAMAFTEEAIVVPPGVTAQEVCWIEPYGSLPQGNYRVNMMGMVVAFTVS